MVPKIASEIEYFWMYFYEIESELRAIMEGIDSDDSGVIKSTLRQNLEDLGTISSNLGHLTEDLTNAIGVEGTRNIKKADATTLITGTTDQLEDIMKKFTDIATKIDSAEASAAITGANVKLKAAVTKLSEIASTIDATDNLKGVVPILLKT